MEDYISYLHGIIPEKDNLKTVRAEAEKFCRAHSPEDYRTTGLKLYQTFPKLWIS